MSNAGQGSAGNVLSAAASLLDSGPGPTSAGEVSPRDPLLYRRRDRLVCLDRHPGWIMHLLGLPRRRPLETPHLILRVASPQFHGPIRPSPRPTMLRSPSAPKPPCLFPILLACLVFQVRAAVVPSALFSNNAVLQQGMPVRVWGTAADGEKVTVEFAGQKVAATAANASWSVTLPPMKAGSQPAHHDDQRALPTRYALPIFWSARSGSAAASRTWSASLVPARARNRSKTGRRRRPPQITSCCADFVAKQTMSTNPLTDVSGNWQVCTPQTVTNFTAVGYYFGRDLRGISVCLGLLHVSWGGTPAEAGPGTSCWRPIRLLAPILQRYTNEVATYAARCRLSADEPRLQQEYTNVLAQALAEAKPTPRPPAPPRDPLKHQNSPSMLQRDAPSRHPLCDPRCHLVPRGGQQQPCEGVPRSLPRHDR